MGLELRAPEAGGGSEDYTYMIRRVQERGGMATTAGVGGDINGAGHHTAQFDIDERAMTVAMVLLTGTALDLMADPLPLPRRQ